MSNRVSLESIDANLRLIFEQLRRTRNSEIPRAIRQSNAQHLETDSELAGMGRAITGMHLSVDRRLASLEALEEEHLRERIRHGHERATFTRKKLIVNFFAVAIATFIVHFLRG